eukprot:COSAG02_NODE_240_length_27672_cov_67.291445_23_plen_77_part_00
MNASGVSIVTTRVSAASAARTGLGNENIDLCVRPSYHPSFPAASTPSLRWISESISSGLQTSRLLGRLNAMLYAQE